MPQYQLPRGRSRRTALRITIVVAVLLLLIGARTIASVLIDYQWWKELGQVQTWLAMYLYSVAPHRRRYPGSVRRAVVDTCTRAEVRRNRPERARHLRAAVRHCTAGHRLSHCFRSTRFLDRRALRREPKSSARRAGLARSGIRAAAGFLPFRPAVLFRPAPVPAGAHHRLHPALLDWRRASGSCATASRNCARCASSIPASSGLEGGLESRFLRGALVVALVALALRFFLGRYEMVLNQHNFLVGADYVDNFIVLPLQWLLIAACLAAAVFVWMGRWVLAVSMALALVVRFIVPGAVSALVRAAQRNFARTALH